MNFELTRRQQEFRDSFASFCDTAILPHFIEGNPSEFETAFLKLSKYGFQRLFYPEALGGTGADGIMLAIGMETLASRWPGLAWSGVVSAALCGKLLEACLTDAIREKYLHSIITGRKIGAFAYVEGVGCDFASYRTKAVRTTGGYVLNGKKSRIANITRADFTNVYCRMEEGGQHGTGFVVVNLNQPGIERVEIPRLGLHGMHWGEVTFTDVFVPEEDLLASSIRSGGITFDQALKPIEWGQIMQACCATGVAASALKCVVDFLRDRNGFGQSLLHIPAVHTKLAQMRTDLEAARLLAYEAAWIKASGQDAKASVLQAKIYCTEMVARVSTQALVLFGGWGYSKWHPMERIFRDSFAGMTSGAQNDFMRDAIACDQLGLSPHEHRPLDWLIPAGLAPDSP